MAPKKVCIFTETYYPVVGGGERQAQTLAEDLVGHGFSVIVLTRRSHASLQKIEKFGAITVYRLPPVGSEHYKKWFLLFTSLSVLIKLHRHYDLIFVSGFRLLGIPAVLLSRLYGKACVLKADSLGEMSGDFFNAGLAKFGAKPSLFLFQLFIRLRNTILKRADSFVAISSQVATELIAHGVRPDRIQRIPNSVDAIKFHPVGQQERQALRRKLGFSRWHRIVIYTGRLVSYKGLPLLLKVWQEFRSRHPDVGLLLVGSGGLDIHNCEDDLKDYVAVSRLQGVRFTGSVNNVHEYLQASDIFVLPTHSEAFGISLIEAMACGLPVISTNVGGVIDILEHRYNGLVVTPGDFQQLYRALDELVSDSALSVCLGQRARHTILKKYSSQIVIKKYMNLFQDLVGEDLV